MLRIPNALTSFALAAVVLAIFFTTRPSAKRDTSRAAVSDKAHFAQLTISGDTRVSADGRYAVHINQPDGPPHIELGPADPQGRAARVACATCHSVRKPNLSNRQPQDLDEFHQGMQFDHGKLACYSCHNPTDANTLRLADDSAVEYRDVMTLCSQCHGPQATSFAHGAHGGMNGFWDLTRGPQQRNNCIDCHDPHAPSYPHMLPTFKPRDRFLEPIPEQQHDAN